MKKLYLILLINSVMLQGNDQKIVGSIKERQVKAMNEIHDFFSSFFDQQNFVTKEEVEKSYVNFSLDVKDGMHIYKEQESTISYLVKYINAIKKDSRAKECHWQIHDYLKNEIEEILSEKITITKLIDDLNACNRYINDLEKSIMQEFASDQK